MTAWVRFVHALSGHFRRGRSQILRDNCPDLKAKRVCDLGGSRHFWETMPPDLVPEDLVLLNIADDGQSRSHTGRFDRLQLQFYDGQHIPYPDGYFDVVICNSVIEHVPLELRRQLCREIQRVSRYYFLQTPAFAFPIEPHFVVPAAHWLPRTLGRKLVPFGIWAVLNRPTKAKMDSYFDEVHLLTRREVADLLPGAKIESERLLGLVKSYTAHGHGLVPAVEDPVRLAS